MAFDAGIVDVEDEEETEQLGKGLGMHPQGSGSSLPPGLLLATSDVFVSAVFETLFRMLPDSLDIEFSHRNVDE